MTFPEIKELLSMFGAFGLGGITFGLILFFFIKSFIPSYLSKKAENLATREDIAKITDEVERVKSQYSILIEELKVKHQLRLAAIDRRLQAHQEAFVLWRELLGSIPQKTVSETILKCQSWWESNCLYLEPEVRQAFVESYTSADLHQALVQAQSDSKAILEVWRDFTKFPDVLFKSIKLPALTEFEITSLKPDSCKP